MIGCEDKTTAAFLLCCTMVLLFFILSPYCECKTTECHKNVDSLICLFNTLTENKNVLLTKTNKNIQIYTRGKTSTRASCYWTWKVWPSQSSEMTSDRRLCTTILILNTTVLTFRTSASIYATSQSKQRPQLGFLPQSWSRWTSVLSDHPGKHQSEWKGEKQKPLLRFRKFRNVKIM